MSKCAKSHLELLAMDDKLPFFAFCVENKKDDTYQNVPEIDRLKTLSYNYVF